MKHFIFLGLLCGNLLGANEPLETLHQLEGCFDAMKPATEKSSEAFAWYSGMPHPFFNSVMHLTCKDVAKKVDTLIQKAPPGTPVAFWVHEQNKAEGLAEILKERGFQGVITAPLMEWKVVPVAKAKMEVRPAKMDIFFQIHAKVNELEEPLATSFAQFNRGAAIENYLVYLDGKPVGTGSLFPNGKVGGVFDVAVLPEFQRKGCGRAIMLYIMNRAHELGLKKLVLLSSPEAEKLYKDLGFTKAIEVEVFMKL